MINQACKRALDAASKELDAAYDNAPIGSMEEAEIRDVRKELDKFLGRVVVEAPPPKECKGKGAARALAVMVLNPQIRTFLSEYDPKALEQAEKSLEPFGYPDVDALHKKFGL